MIKHPDGTNMTENLLELSGLKIGSSILDMGAGDGEAVSFLASIGYNAMGIDLSPGTAVSHGDMTCLPFSDSLFDGVLGECSFSVCGDTAKALSEAHRVLKSGGILMLSDVYFKSGLSPTLSLPVPADKSGWISTASGFSLMDFHDQTDLWTEFIIDCIWNGRDIGDCGFYKSAAKAKCGYFISIWKKI